MSKKHQLPAEQQPQPQPPVPAQDRAPEAEVSNAHIITFWSGLVLAVVIARALNYALPGVPESVIERWVMLGFGVFAGIFLFKLR